MKIKFLLLLLTLTLNAGEIFQVSTFSSLMDGVYDGDYRYSELFKKGNFGLGTFNRTNGEMVALDGKFYQDSPSGLLKLVSPTEKTPFACVTFFKSTYSAKLKGIKSFKQLGKFLDQFIDKHNTPYAIRIDGTFRYLKLRSLRKQEPPYEPLPITSKQQHEYEVTNTEGTLVGFWFPEYLNGVNVGGFHFHYIDSKRSSGGHVLDLSMTSGESFFMPADSLTIDFPNTEAFDHAELQEGNEAIHGIEN